MRSCVVLMGFRKIGLSQWFPVNSIGTATKLVTKGFPNTRFSFLLQIEIKKFNNRLWCNCWMNIKLFLFNEISKAGWGAKK